jgi:hypothetical protein
MAAPTPPNVGQIAWFARPGKMGNWPYLSISLLAGRAS